MNVKTAIGVTEPHWTSLVRGPQLVYAERAVRFTAALAEVVTHRGPELWAH